MSTPVSSSVHTDIVEAMAPQREMDQYPHFRSYIDPHSAPRSVFEHVYAADHGNHAPATQFRSGCDYLNVIGGQEHYFVSAGSMSTCAFLVC